MPLPLNLDDPEYWRSRAAEARAIADQMKDPVSQETMLKVAAGYDDLAARAERSIKGKPKV